MFPFEDCPSPSTNTLLSASAHFISTSVLNLLAGSSTLTLPPPGITAPSLPNGAVELFLVERSEPVVPETLVSPTDSNVYSTASSSASAKSDSSSPTKIGPTADPKIPAVPTSSSTSMISKGVGGKGPQTTPHASALGDTQQSEGGRSGVSEPSGTQNGADLITSSTSITPTGHWITLALPTAYVATGGLYQSHGKIYDDGFRQGYQDGCYDHAYSTHPATLNGEYFIGYRKGRDSGIRDCRPLDGNDQSGSGWSDDVLLPSSSSSVTLALWLLVMPCLLTLMLHVL